MLAFAQNASNCPNNILKHILSLTFSFSSGTLPLYTCFVGSTQNLQGVRSKLFPGIGFPVPCFLEFRSKHLSCKHFCIFVSHSVYKCPQTNMSLFKELGYRYSEYSKHVHQTWLTVHVPARWCEEEQLSVLRAAAFVWRNTALDIKYMHSKSDQRQWMQFKKFALLLFRRAPTYLFWNPCCEGKHWCNQSFYAIGSIVVGLFILACR